MLRGGCWRNLNFQRENPWIRRSNECHDLNANPWIQHFRSSSKHPSVTSSPAIEESDTSTIEVADLCQSRGNGLCKPHDFSHQDMLCDDTGATKFPPDVLCFEACRSSLALLQFKLNCGVIY